MSNYQSVWIDGVGSVVVEDSMADRHPHDDPIWPDIGLFLSMYIAHLDGMLTRARRMPHLRRYLRRGIGNLHMRLTFTVFDENETLIEEEMWFEFLHSSVNGDELRRIIFVRSGPPEDFFDS
jgi:hypothetical protein